MRRQDRAQGNGGAIAVMAVTFLVGSGAANRGEEPPRIVTAKDDQGLARSLAVTISTAKSEYRQLEPIVVEFEARNVDPEGRELVVPGHHHRHPRVKVYWQLDPRLLHTPVPPTRYDQSGKHASDGDGNVPGERLKPSAVRRGTLVANLVTDMTDPGVYTIVAEIDFGSADEAGKGKPVVAHSNAIELKVKEIFLVPDPR